MQKQNKISSRVEEWQHTLLWLVTGLLVFETLTGLLIYFLPFSVSNQVMVFLHTAFGLIFILPYAWYQLRHWRIYRTMAMTHIKLTGYLSMFVTIIAGVTGLILTYQAIWQRKISAGMDVVHIIATFALIVLAAPHFVIIMWRNFSARQNEMMQPLITAEKRFGLKTLFFTVILFVPVVLFVYAYSPVQFDNAFPENYSYLFGKERPFAPSLATTSTGGAFDARSLGGSEGCGNAGCHEQIYHEWQVSAHRYSAMDPAFQAVQNVMATQNGAESTRYCGGCHDPISLFSGEKNVFNDKLTNLTGYQEGVSCIVCHGIKTTDIKGNAHYVVTQPERYMFELSEGGTGRFLRDFIIRAYPRYHVESLQHRLFKSPEFCAACHKQFIDQDINKVGWVQLQNQYDNWRTSRWNHKGDPEKTIECRECHMPLVDSDDPGRGDPLDYNRSAGDQKHRSHRFLGANQFVPKLLKIEGADEHIELTQKWLQGKIDIPEIADKWRAGRAVPIELVVPEQVTPGQNVKIQAIVTNNKVGHDFPTGPLDIIQSWIEIVITDQSGKELFTSGVRDDRHFIEPGSFIFKAEAVDQYGNLIDRHNLWEMVGVRYRRTLFPGFADRAEFSFSCPADVVSKPSQKLESQDFEFSVPENQHGEIHVSAKLLYRKIDQFLLNYLFGEDAKLTAPVTVMSEDSKSIEIVAASND